MKLPRFSKGDPLRADDMQRLVDALRPLLDIRGMGGIRVQRTTNSILISSKRQQGRGGGVAGELPFEIVAAGTAEDGSPQVQVALDSWLLRSPRWSDRVTITGLGAPFPIADGDLIWLELTFDSGEGLTSAEIKHGEPWFDYDSPVQFDDLDSENKRQEKAFTLIGFAQAVPDPNPYTERLIVTGTGEEPVTLQIVQCVTTHLLLCRQCFEGDTIQMPVPWFAPGPPPE